MRRVPSDAEVIRWLATMLMGVAIVGLLAIIGGTIAQAQEAVPRLVSEQAYTTDDPVDPDRLGLATHDGRYSIALLLDAASNPVCGLVRNTTPLNVNVWGPLDATGSMYVVMPVEVQLEADQVSGCPIRVYRRMDLTPCFQIDGVCDMTAESDLAGGAP